MTIFKLPMPAAVLPQPLHLDPQTQRMAKRLMLATAISLAGHALLLWGLPNWWWLQDQPRGQPTESFITRLVVPKPPAPVAAPEPAPPVPTPQATEKIPLQPKPKPTRRERVKPPSITPPSATSEPAASSEKTESTPSLLAPRTGARFGGSSLPEPITPSLSEGDRKAAQLQIATAGDAPVVIPPAGDLTYQVTGLSKGVAYNNGISTLTWRHDGIFYDSKWYFYHVKVGEDTLRASGLITPQGLAPAQAGQRVTFEQTTTFDYSSQRLRFSDGPSEASLPPGAQDRLSALMQLGALLGAAPDRYPVGSAIRLPLTGGRGVGFASFAVEAEEPLTALEGKTLRTIRLVHTAMQDGDPKIEVWLGPQVEYLPVRFRVTQPNGDFAEHNLQHALAVRVPVYSPPAQPPPGATASQPAS